MFVNHRRKALPHRTNGISAKNLQRITQILKGRPWTFGLLCSMLAFALLFGACGPSEMPCASDGDCLRKAYCADGYCRDIQQGDGNSEEGQANKENRNSEKTTTDAGDAEKSSEPKANEPDNGDSQADGQSTNDASENDDEPDTSGEEVETIEEPSRGSDGKEDAGETTEEPSKQTESAPSDTTKTPDATCTTKPYCKTLGVCQKVKISCVKGSWVCQYPPEYTSEEKSCDGLDNDCDGTVDENCACKSGDKQPCGSATGECQKGTQRCNGKGQWEPCIGAKGPSVELCDGKDNDCDGQIDELLHRGCYSGAAGTVGKGLCKAGKQTCHLGQWGRCIGEIKPENERCDGKDNDCDGTIDEGCACRTGMKRACGNDTGLCKKGTQICDNQGQWGRCVGEVAPQKELCNGKDDDCDGFVDENVQRSCYSGVPKTKGVGLCQQGIQNCRAGKWEKCVGEIVPRSEVCNGVDDDCDGFVDENLRKACYSGPTITMGKGPCKMGQTTCSQGRWGQCVGEVSPQKEVCDGKDNDCDGRVDNHLVRTCYSGPAGTASKGICSSGKQTCQAGKWGQCVGEVKPVQETCDLKDNDCDGKVDDGSSICSAGKSCLKGKCVCDQSKGSFPYGNGCVKGGDICSAALKKGPACLNSRYKVFCDPFGRVSFIDCSTFTGTSCATIAGMQGCRAPSSLYNVRRCASFATVYKPTRTWHSVVKGVGLDKNNAIIRFEEDCVGNGRTQCGTVVASVGYESVCLCAERKLQCAGQTRYDPLMYSSYFKRCISSIGPSFSCLNSYRKTTVGGFATYY